MSRTARCQSERSKEEQDIFVVPKISTEACCRRQGGVGACRVERISTAAQRGGAIRLGTNGIA